MKKALLVVSFGTSYKETREKTLDVIERELSEAAEGYDFKKAFTSYMIMKKLKNRDGIHIDNAKEAMEKLVAEGYEEVIVQPTHILNGDEYEKMNRLMEPFIDSFNSVKVGKPMLTTSEDYDLTVEAIMDEVGALAEDEALVLMGHGTGHFSDSAYAALDYRFKARGYKNVFVGTVEGFPEIDDLMPLVKEYNPKTIKLLPFMIVAGDHATNDMASDEEDSWKTIFLNEGFQVEIILRGLGEFAGIRDIFKQHMLELVSEN